MMNNLLFITGLFYFFISTILIRFPIQAIPAFARQNGVACMACHVGSFGPQLNSYGRAFKLNGYQWGKEKKKIKDYLRSFSAMAVGGIEHTKGDLRKGQELVGNEARFKSNNNITFDQMSLFYGGSLFKDVGMFLEVKRSNSSQSTSLDNTDIRFVRSGEINDSSYIIGLSINNNPTVQDVWQTNPTWSFPYFSSAFLQSPAASPYISQLGESSIGAGVYALWNHLIYAEISAYSTLADKLQKGLGVTHPAENDRLRGLAPYWRLAIQNDFGPHYVELGTYGIHANRYPGNQQSNGSDSITDLAIDGTYQFNTDDNEHSISVYTSMIFERANLHSTLALGRSINATNSLINMNANFSYYFKNTYGLTFGGFSTTGSSDALLYENSASGSPDSMGETFQVDYTPFGKDGSFAAPNFNLRCFVQYTNFNKFNGLSANYDGTGRNAADNNLLFAGVWLAF